MKVLVVEDHPDIAQSLVNALTDLRLAAEVAATGHDADERLRTDKYGLVVLDLSLPGLDGIELLRRLRAFDRHTPVLVLTARGSIDDRVRGLQSGADDYLTKPFDLREFEARVSALLRRVGGGSLQAGRLQFDSTNRAFAIDGVPLELTPRESAVLEALIARLGRVVAKEVLFDKVFALDTETTPKALEVYVHRLRKKLTGSGVSITTLRGLGYALKVDD